MAQSWPDYTHVGRLYISFYPALNNIKKKNKRKNTNTNTNKSARPCPPATGFRWLAALRPPSCEAPASRCLRRGASAPPCYASVLLRSPAAFWLFLFFFFFILAATAYHNEGDSPAPCSAICMAALSRSAIPAPLTLSALPWF